MTGPLADAATRPQRTIAQPARVTGFGYWSGRDVTVEFRPALADAGLCFVRDDLPGRPRIPVDIAQRIDMPLRTALAADATTRGPRVEMVEHALAALAGLWIDNCEIGVTAAELPGYDGSSRLYVDALLEAGVCSQPEPCHRFEIERPLRVASERASLQAGFEPNGRLRIDYELNYPDAPAIGRQAFSAVITPETFVREIAPARTFVRKAEADQLLARGLCRRVGFQDLLVFDDDGPIDNELRFPNECVRHKVLDLIGDLTLLGRPLAGRLHAVGSGHRMNAELVASLRSPVGAAVRCVA